MYEEYEDEQGCVKWEESMMKPRNRLCFTHYTRSLTLSSFLFRISYSHCRGSSLPVFKSASVLQRTSSPVLGASPSGLAGTTAGGKGAAASVDAKGKGGGKKRKSEAADKQPKTAVAAAGEDG